MSALALNSIKFEVNAAGVMVIRAQPGDEPSYLHSRQGRNPGREGSAMGRSRRLNTLRAMTVIGAQPHPMREGAAKRFLRRGRELGHASDERKKPTQLEDFLEPFGSNCMQEGQPTCMISPIGH